MILTDALPAAMPPSPSSSSAALPRRRDSQDDRHEHGYGLPVDRVVDAAGVHAGAGVGTGTDYGVVSRGRPPSPFIGAGTIVAMQWVVFGTAVARWLIL